MRLVHSRPTLSWNLKLVPWLLQLLQWFQSELFAHFFNGSFEGGTTPTWCTHTSGRGDSYVRRRRISCVFQPWGPHPSEHHFPLWKCMALIWIVVSKATCQITGCDAFTAHPVVSLCTASHGDCGSTCPYCSSYFITWQFVCLASMAGWPLHYRSFTSHQQNGFLCINNIGESYWEKGRVRFSCIWGIHCPSHTEPLRQALS